MSRIAFYSQYLGDYLKAFTTFTVNFQSYSAANVGQYSREMY
jgi:hypothetical protein